MRTCGTDNCERTVPFEGHRFCDSCAGIVLRTGRPPVIAVKFTPRWLKNLQAKDFSNLEREVA